MQKRLLAFGAALSTTCLATCGGDDGDVRTPQGNEAGTVGGSGSAGAGGMNAGGANNSGTAGASGGGGSAGGPSMQNPCDVAHDETVEVATSDELASALAAARPGVLIHLADGTYEGKLEGTVPGTADKPVVLCGGAGAVLSGRPYGFHLAADHWVLAGVSVTGALKGVVLDNASGCQLVSLTVHDVDEEGVHFRAFSRDNTLRNSTIYATGRVTPGFGEGVYLGSAKSNWGDYSDGEPDTSDGNQIVDNTIGPDVTAEAIDVKEGTTGGTLRGNVFVGRGMSGENFADSWVDLKGNGYVVDGNVGTDTLRDGFQVHVAVEGWGEGNTFRGNQATVNGPGYGFAIDEDAAGNVIGCDNVVTGAALGLANVACAP